MKITATAALAAIMLAGVGTAHADESGQLACQLSLAQFTDDVAAARDRLRPGHLAAARQLVDVGYDQCRSSSNLVMADIRALRQDLRLSSGGHGMSGLAWSWPSKDEQLSELRE